MNGDFELGKWAVHPKLNAVVRDNVSHHVSPKAVEVLVYLAEHQGDVVSKEDIIAAVWSGTFVTDDALTRCIGELRRVFEDDAREPNIIQTIAKRGYRLVPPVRWLRDRPSLENGQADTGPAEAAGTTEVAGTRSSAASRRVSRFVAVAAVSLALIAGVVTGVGVMVRLRPLAVRSPVITAIDLEPGYVLASGNSRADIPTRTAMAISSDSSFVVYCAKREGTRDRRLFLRRLAKLHATEIAGTEGAEAPFLSPDDRRVGFVVGRQLKWVSTEGGTATALGASVVAPFGASWGSDGYVAFSAGFDDGLQRVRSDPGIAEILTRRLPDEFHHRLPHYLPRGKGVLFTVASQPMDPKPRIAVVDEDGRTHILLDDAADARYVSTGHLVFVRQGSLMAVPFDLDRLSTTGKEIPLGIGVAQALNEYASTQETDAGQFAVSEAGALVYAAGGIAVDEKHALVWVEQDGREAGRAVPTTAPFIAARQSPNGQKIAYTVSGMNNRVWVCDVNGGAPSGLADRGYVNFAIWTGDSQRVVFGLSTSGPPNLFERPVDQSTLAKAITTGGNWIGQGPGSFSPDGDLAFWRQFPNNTQQILIRDGRSGAITPFIEGQPGEQL